MSRHTTYFELLDALGLPGCPLCRLAAGSVRAYFDSFGYELVNDPPLRQRLREAGGFCPRHAWQFVEQDGSRLGAAIVYRDLLQQASQGVKRRTAAAPDPVRRSIRRLFGGPPVESASRAAGSCPACEAERESEERYRSTLVEHLGVPDLRARFAGSAGLCLPHVHRALASDGRAADLAWLAEDAVGRLGQLVAELDEFIRKHDYRFQRERWGDERDSPFRAVERAVGPKWPE